MNKMIELFSARHQPKSFLASFESEFDKLMRVDRKTLKKWLIIAGLKPRFFEKKESMASRFIGTYESPSDKISIDIDRNA